MGPVNVKIYLIKDSHGNEVSATCQDSCDTIQINGISNKGGESIFFESEAYHLKEWCEDFELEYKCVDMTYAFGDIWNNNQ